MGSWYFCFISLYHMPMGQVDARIGRGGSWGQGQRAGTEAIADDSLS